MNYIMFLRGINVGNIRISMSELKECLATISDLKDIKTYLQTGNVSFTSDLSAPELKPAIEQALQKHFNYDAHVLLFPAETIRETISEYPFELNDSAHRYAIFCSSKDVAVELLSHRKDLDSSIEDIAEGKSVIYWTAPKGRATETAFSKILSRPKYKATTTNRNVNTLEKILLAITLNKHK